MVLWRTAAVLRRSLGRDGVVAFLHVIDHLAYAISISLSIFNVESRADLGITECINMNMYIYVILHYTI